MITRHTDFCATTPPSTAQLDAYGLSGPVPVSLLEVKRKRKSDLKKIKIKKKEQRKKKWLNIHFVGCPDITKKNKINKMLGGMASGSRVFETAEIARNRVIPQSTVKAPPSKSEHTPSAVTNDDDWKDDEKGDPEGSKTEGGSVRNVNLQIMTTDGDDGKDPDAEHPDRVPLANDGAAANPNTKGSATVDLDDLDSISLVGNFEPMERQRSQSGPVPKIKRKKNKLSVNAIYSLKGVESRSIRIRVNPHKFKVIDLTNYIAAKFQIPRTSKILLTYHNYMLSVETATIAYYGIRNHSCLLLSISEAPKRESMKWVDHKKKRGPEYRVRGQRAPPQRRRRGSSANPLRAVPAIPDSPPLSLRAMLRRDSPRPPRISSRRRRMTTLRATARTVHRPTASADPPSDDNEGGISGIGGASNNVLVPDSSGRMSLAQSTSKVARGGLLSILDDEALSDRERVNLFTKMLDIERVTDRDIYSIEFDSNCFAMGCGHGMPKETLFAFAEVAMKNGALSLECPHLRDPDGVGNELCKAPWPMQAVRKILLSGESPRIPMESDDDPTRSVPKWEQSLFGVIVLGFMRSYELRRFAPRVQLLIYQFSLDKKLEAKLMRPDVKRMMALEIECAKNKFIDTFDYQKCPQCSLFLHRPKAPMSAVQCFSQCPLCRTRFCWICSGPWTGSRRVEYCSNTQCDVSITKQHLSILKTCPRKTINVPGVPSTRACPKCNALIYHETACKHMDCIYCGTKFCFTCLRLKENGEWQCGSYSAPCEVAERQDVDALSNTNRGNVVLFQLKY